MSVTLSVTEDQVMAALRVSFLLAILPTGIEVVQAQDNQVAAPVGPDYVVFTPLMRKRLATNIVNTVDGFFDNPVIGGTRTDLAETELTVQLDVYGPASADNTQIITTLFRSELGVDLFSNAGVDVTPLYHGEPRQTPYTNDQQQVEQRWTFELAMQVNAVVTSEQDFFSTANVDLIQVDATYGN